MQLTPKRAQLNHDRHSIQISEPRSAPSLNLSGMQPFRTPKKRYIAPTPPHLFLQSFKHKRVTRKKPRKTP